LSEYRMLEFLDVYQPSYFRACVKILQSNTPYFFAEYEQKEFEKFLEFIAESKNKNDEAFHPDYSTKYYVLKYDAAKIIGCGGMSINREEDTGYLRWSMIDASYHHMQWGSLLTFSRMRYLIEYPHIKKIRLYTSSATVGFYEKLGFCTDECREDYYREGLHRYDMTLLIDEAMKKRIIDREKVLRSNSRELISAKLLSSS
jgi:ribosomal protein S18 acetylase RimI-like enzyme